MKTVEEMKKLIDEVNEFEHEANVRKHAILEYTGLLDEYNRRMAWNMDKAEEVYENAIDHIYGEYIPDPEHAETYYGGYDPEPVTFDEIKRLYKEWGIEDDFETFFETWEKAE